MSRRGAFLCSVVTVAAALGAAEACGQPAAPAASGDTCELTSECQEGYVCIKQADGTRQCSSDLSSIQLTEEAGAEAAAMPMEGAAPQGDSGAPQADTGSPPVDTGAPPVDTGSPPQEAGGD